MKLSNKYNIPQETIDKMIRDGIIGCQWSTYEAVYEAYITLKGSGKSQSDIYADLAERFKMSAENVRKIIPKLGKILYQ
jgi:hypothetical protein